MQPIMMRSLRFTLAIVVLGSLVLPLTGCSGSDNQRFALCGNGRLDPGEQCDDGNVDDGDDCLSTCVVASCGDTFVDSLGSRVEQCDSANLAGNSCTSVGLGSGTLACTAGCTFDTSGCAPAPTPTATPTATATATPTNTPTYTVQGATPTPSSQVGCESVSITVALHYDVNDIPELSGLVVDLNYPAAKVNIPGSGDDASVLVRVTDLSAAGGLPIITDRDSNSDGSDDQLHNVYVTSNNIPPTDFERVLFDCNATTAPPLSSEFTCVVSDAVDPQAFPVDGVTCSVGISVKLLPTPTPPSPTPTVPIATATPVPTCETVKISVALTYDTGALPELAGLVLDLNYPGSLNIPGSGSDPSVAGRVTDVSHANGIAILADRDADTDGTDDQLSNTYATATNIAPAAFEEVLFDCRPGATRPTNSAFTCALSDTVDPQGFNVEGVGCIVTVTSP